MKKILRWLKLAAPFIHLAIDEVEIIGAGNTKLKKTVDAVKYIDKILDAVVNNTEIPDAPESLRGNQKQVEDKKK